MIGIAQLSGGTLTPRCSSCLSLFSEPHGCCGKEGVPVSATMSFPEIVLGHLYVFDDDGDTKDVLKEATIGPSLYESKSTLKRMDVGRVVWLWQGEIHDLPNIFDPEEGDENLDVGIFGRIEKSDGLILEIPQNSLFYKARLVKAKRRADSETDKELLERLSRLTTYCRSKISAIAVVQGEALDGWVRDCLQGITERVAQHTSRAEAVGWLLNNIGREPALYTGGFRDQDRRRTSIDVVDIGGLGGRQLVSSLHEISHLRSENLKDDSNVDGCVPMRKGGWGLGKTYLAGCYQNSETKIWARTAALRGSVVFESDGIPPWRGRFRRWVWPDRVGSVLDWIKRFRNRMLLQWGMTIYSRSASEIENVIYQPKVRPYLVIVVGKYFHRGENELRAAIKHFSKNRTEPDFIIHNENYDRNLMNQVKNAFPSAEVETYSEEAPWSLILSIASGYKV